jgi:hypothetical protein
MIFETFLAIAQFAAKNHLRTTALARKVKSDFILCRILLQHQAMALLRSYGDFNIAAFSR